MKTKLFAALHFGASLVFACSDPSADAINETIQENNEKISENAEKNTAIETTHSLDEAVALLAREWDVKEPHTLPDGYSLMDYYVYDKDMIEIRYSDANDHHELYYRTSTREDDISGNTNPYTNEEELSSSSISKILVRGSDEVWMVASWKEDDITYSITCEDGLTEDVLLTMIDSIH